jgi:hypothetical protein
MPASRNWVLSLYNNMSDRDILAGVIQGIERTSFSLWEKVASGAGRMSRIVDLLQRLPGGDFDPET